MYTIYRNIVKKAKVRRGFLYKDNEVVIAMKGVNVWLTEAQATKHLKRVIESNIAKLEEKNARLKKDIKKTYDNYIKNKKELERLFLELEKS